MSWSDFFYGIEDVFNSILSDPFDAIRHYETYTNWWAASTLNWIFMLICAAAIVYWLKQLQAYNANDTEDRSVVSHEFLGPNSNIESK